MTDPEPIESRPAETPLEQPFDPSSTSPTDAFSALGNRTRLSILRALWNAESTPVPYAELERRTSAETDNFT